MPTVELHSTLKLRLCWTYKLWPYRSSALCMDTMGCPARRVCSSSIQARFGAGCLCRAASSMLKQLHSSVTHLAEPAAKRTRTQAGPCPTTCSASGRDLPVRHALHVCVNKTCKRQGSKEVRLLKQLALLVNMPPPVLFCLAAGASRRKALSLWQ